MTVEWTAAGAACMPGVARQCFSTICQCTYSTDTGQLEICPSIISTAFVSVCIRHSVHISVFFSIRPSVHPSIQTWKHPSGFGDLRSVLASTSTARFFLSNILAAVCSNRPLWYFLVNISCLMIFFLHAGACIWCTFGKHLDIFKFLRAFPKYLAPELWEHHSGTQAHRCAQTRALVAARRTARSGSPLSRSRPWATHWFRRPPPFNFTPTPQCGRENVNITLRLLRVERGGPHVSHCLWRCSFSGVGSFWEAALNNKRNGVFFPLYLAKSCSVIAVGWTGFYVAIDNCDERINTA